MFGNLAITQKQIVGIVVTIAIIAALQLFGKNAPPRTRALSNYVSAAVTGGGLAYWVGAISPQLENTVGILKMCLAFIAVSAVFYEVRRAQERRPIAMRWKKFVGIGMGVAAIVLYFHGFKVGYAKFWHRHDQYHYYFGAKYFRELGYDGLYKCTIVAQDEIGKVCKSPSHVKQRSMASLALTDEIEDCKPGQPWIVDMGAEVDPEKAKTYCQPPVQGETVEVLSSRDPKSLSPAEQRYLELMQDPAGYCGREHSPEDEKVYACPVLKAACDKKIRNLGGDNLLKPATTALEHPEECDPNVKDANGNVVSKFTPDRWAQFKKDVRFFRVATLDGKDYWDGMQKDHGYNPPPVWTLTGYLISSLHDASQGFMQALGLIDELYIVAMFAGIYWAFGWRIFAVAAILWGCQASAPNYWTLGAFLRQDWLFWFVMAACFARKRYFKLAGASMVYSALLRVFPGLAVIGWLTVAGAFLVKHRRMRGEHVQTLVGGTLAAVVLVGASLAVVGKDSYQQFYKHTIEVHDQTPLTNHMGLRVMIEHRTECLLHLPGCEGKASGRMMYTQDNTALDPFEVWKDMRLARYAKYKGIAYAIMAASLVLFVLVVRRVKSLWVGQALGQVWIILLSQLTSYYYAFIIISAPLTRVRRDLEIWLFGFAAVTQIIWRLFPMNDDKYTILTYFTLAFCYGLIFAFAPKKWAFWKKEEPELPPGRAR
jgi:hypothetical protein